MRKQEVQSAVKHLLFTYSCYRDQGGIELRRGCLHLHVTNHYLSFTLIELNQVYIYLGIFL